MSFQGSRVALAVAVLAGDRGHSSSSGGSAFIGDSYATGIHLPAPVLVGRVSIKSVLVYLIIGIFVSLFCGRTSKKG